MSELERKKILAADVPEALVQIQRALSSDYELALTSSVREAKQLLIDNEKKNFFDLVVAGLHFDDSRMFDLLQYIRAVDHFDRTAFLPVQIVKSDTKMLLVNLQEPLTLLGSCPVVKLVNLSPESADRRLQRAVIQAMSNPVRFQRIDESPHIPIKLAK